MPIGNDFAGSTLWLRTNRAPCREVVGLIEGQRMKKKNLRGGKWPVNVANL